MEIQPMPSARLEAGRYEVIGTSNSVEVRKGIGGWWVVVNGTPTVKFHHKRTALQFCQEHPEL